VLSEIGINQPRQPEPKDHRSLPSVETTTPVSCMIPPSAKDNTHLLFDGCMRHTVSPVAQAQGDAIMSFSSTPTLRWFLIGKGV
jgi:hypothetical protein